MQGWRSPFPWIGPKICKTCSGRLSLHQLLWDPCPGWTGNLSLPLFLSILSWLLKNNDFCSDNNLYKGSGTRFSLSASLSDCLKPLIEHSLESLGLGIIKSHGFFYEVNYLYNGTEARFSIFASPSVAPSSGWTVVCVCVSVCVCVCVCLCNVAISTSPPVD